jgi:hypothetical protein
VYVCRGMCMCIGVCVSVEGYVHVYRGMCMCIGVCVCV